jgi:hypothetical protein
LRGIDPEMFPRGDLEEGLERPLLPLEQLPATVRHRATTRHPGVEPTADLIPRAPAFEHAEPGAGPLRHFPGEPAVAGSLKGGVEEDRVPPRQGAFGQPKELGIRLLRLRGRIQALAIIRVRVHSGWDARQALARGVGVEDRERHLFG